MSIYNGTLTLLINLNIQNSLNQSVCILCIVHDSILKSLLSYGLWIIFNVMCHSFYCSFEFPKFTCISDKSTNDDKAVPNLNDDILYSTALWDALF